MAIDLTPIPLVSLADKTPDFAYLLGIINTLKAWRHPADMTRIQSSLATLTPPALGAIISASQEILSIGLSYEASSESSTVSLHAAARAFVIALANSVRELDASRDLFYSTHTDRLLVLLLHVEEDYHAQPDSQWLALIDRTLPWLPSLTPQEEAQLLNLAKAQTVRLPVLAKGPSSGLMGALDTLHTPGAFKQLSKHPLCSQSATIMYHMFIIKCLQDAARTEELEESLEGIQSLEAQGHLFPSAMVDFAIVAIVAIVATVTSDVPQVFASIASFVAHPPALSQLLELNFPLVMARLLNSVPAADWPRVLLKSFEVFDDDPEAILSALPSAVTKYGSGLSSKTLATILHRAPHGAKRHLMSLVKSPPSRHII